MNISELKKYPHKIIKINITNENNTNRSDYDTAMLRVTITDKNDNEIIVFSKDDSLSDIIPSKKNENDYYISIPNKKGLSFIFAHYLMADLYDYTEDETDSDIFFSYDLKKLKTQSQLTNYQISDDDKPKVQSLINLDTNTKIVKDPNYKNYTNKGFFPSRFPISSRYNIGGEKEITAPKMNQNPKATWKIDSSNIKPQWEVHIPRNELKIVKEDIGIVNPINVYLNYQYLPTSTDYHQHFFGFEDKKQTQCKNINVLDGDNLNLVNKNFGDNGTYRLINIHGKTNQSQMLFVEHNTREEILFENIEIYDENCSFDKNICDNYYVYNSEKESDKIGFYTDLNLVEDTDYILKYYMWVPADTQITEPCVKITYKDSQKQIHTYELPEIFATQDRYLYNQWIYHEIPFKATTSHHQLHIKGPRKPNQQLYFTHIFLEKIVPYSPTIKYTNKGVFVSEGNSNAINVPNKKHTGPDECDNPIDEGEDIQKELPTPHLHVYIDFDEEFDINYSERTGLLTYTYNPERCTITYCDNNEDVSFGDIIYSSEKNANDEPYVDFEYVYVKRPGLENTDLIVHYIVEKVFSRGVNNSFTLKIHDENDEPITEGQVTCSIVEYSENDKIIIKDLGTKNIGQNGLVEYKRINFTGFTESKYNMEIVYKHPCYKKDTIVQRTIYMVDESLQMSLIAQKGNKTPEPIENKKLEINFEDDFPIRISTHITDKSTNNDINEGYCELSIDDEVRYTTYVDDTGMADFYLNYKTDNLKSTQNIKIVYYRKKSNDEGGYFDPIAYQYFELKINDTFNKDPVPIVNKVLVENYNEQNSNEEITLDKKDCLLIDIDVSDKKYSNYSVRMYKNEELVSALFNDNDTMNFYNVTSASDESIVFSAMYDNEEKEKYTVVTDNLIDEIINGEITYKNNNKYRKYEKSFVVNWIK